MTTTQLYLVRHGETDWNAEGRLQGHSESDLSERGQAQARARSDDIAALGLDAAYCSSSRRARQTAQGLLDGAVDGVVYRDELREICLGPWEGQLRWDIERDYPTLARHYRHQPERFELDGAETFAQLQARGAAALARIAADHPGQKVLVVSHGALIKATLLHHLGWPLAQLWQEPEVHNCSCSELVYRDGAVRVVSIADQPV